MWPFGGRFFPGTNLQDLNLDWIVQRVRDLSRGIIAPFINSANLHWMVWDTDAETFVDSGVSAAGEGTGPQGEPGKSPIIGGNGDWYVWDPETSAYVDSGVHAQGDVGPVGPVGPQGETGPQGPRGAGSNQNILDNAVFLPAFLVNQRGQSVYSGGGYTFDRWRLNGNTASGCTVTISDAGVRIQNAGAGSNWLNQPFESQLPAGVYTLSILTTAVSGNSRIELLDASNRVVGTAANISGPGLTEHTITIGNTAVRFAIFLEAGADITVTAAKIEPGNEQTLAYSDSSNNWYLSENPSPAVEWAKCRRYFQKLTVKGAIYGYSIANVLAYTHNQVNLTLRLGMRVPAGNAVAVTYSSLSDIVLTQLRIADGVPLTNISSARVTDSGDVVMLLTTADNALTAGAAYNAAILGSSDGFIAFSTEP